MKKYEDKIKAHPVVKELMEVAKDLGHASSARLTGGAVVDILDGREPKDYDILWIGNKPMVDMKCKHLHQLQKLYFALTGEELDIKINR